MGFRKIKERIALMRWMVFSCVKCLMWRTRTFVVDIGWEISVLSCVRIELMCHLA
jgi:hypothetical protein